MFDKESKHFDAVTVAIPDHNHALVGLSAMQLKKHLYLQKPLTHDIYEARILTQAAEKYKVVTLNHKKLSTGEHCTNKNNYYLVKHKSFEKQIV